MSQLSIVLPAYNFSQGLEVTITKLRTASLPQGTEVIIVDDGSTDDSETHLRELRVPFVVVQLPHNCGKGAALRAGIVQSKGDVVVLTDIDLPYGLEPIKRALVELESCDVVIGSRRLGDSSSITRHAGRRLGSRIFLFLTSTVLGQRFSDTQCGFKVLRGDVARAIVSELSVDGFATDVEFLAVLRKHGYRVHELAVQQIDDAPSTIRFKHLVNMLRDLARIFWRHRILS